MNTALRSSLALLLALAAGPVLAQTTERAGRFQQLVQQRIEAMDTNGDGSISEAEYLAHAKTQFARLDTNGDGQISPQEREAARETLREDWRARNGGQ